MEPTDLSGAVLDGRYKVIEPISEGAMGVVYRAERLKLGRIVAIKVLHDELPAELSSRKRFEIEAMAMAKLEHPHCAAVIDVGVHEDKPFVVMDFVSGDNLAQLIAGGPVPIPRAVEIVRQVLSGLAHAHEHGIIHRDIKPANIVLSQKAGLGDHVKILDFGLARFDNATSNITTGIVVGTPSYMSPEQIRGVLIDHRSDLYACGVLLFELLTGDKPFVSDKDDPVEVCSMHLKQPPPTLASKQPGITFDNLEDIVAKALAKKPEDRFSSAVEFAAALDTVSARRSQPIARATPAVGTPVASETGWAVPVEAKSSFYAPSDGAPLVAAAAPPPDPAADPPRRPGAWDPEAPSQPNPPIAEAPAAPLPGTAGTAGPAPIIDAPSGPAKRAAPAPFNRRVPTPVAGSPTARPIAPTPIAGAPIAAPPPAPMAWVAPSAVPDPVTQPTAAPARVEPFAGAPVGQVVPPYPPSEPPISGPAVGSLVESGDPFAGTPVGQVVPPYGEPAREVKGLPADFDLSRAIPREAVATASAKGLSPGFDLSLAIPAAPETPILERSGQVASSGATAVPEAAPELTTAPAGAITAPTVDHDATILGLAVAKPPGPVTVPGGATAATVPGGAPPLVAISATPPTAKPTDETVLEVPVATEPPAATDRPATDANREAAPPASNREAAPDRNDKSNRETVAFAGAAPAGPSPLAAPDAPAIAEPPAPTPEPWQPTKRQLQVAVGTIGLVILIILIVSIAKCGGGKATPAAAVTSDAAAPPGSSSPPDPVDDALAKANEQYTAGSLDAALDTLLAARKTSPKDARLAYLAGKIYFDKQWWSVGLKQFRDVLALDPTYRAEPELIKIVLKAFITPAEYPAELGSFLRNDIGAPAKPYLQETATSHPRAATRNRAKRELEKMP